jgi:hypothetical protein
MPHGINAIKHHLQEVDNVPLLVSLFTDSTPETIQQMIEIFREYGETVYTIGSGYRDYNSTIFQASNLSTALFTIPGLTPTIPLHINDMIHQLPESLEHALSLKDIQLAMDLIGIGTCNLIQDSSSTSLSQLDDGLLQQTNNNNNNNEAKVTNIIPLMKLSRQLLDNQFQIMAFITTCQVSGLLVVLLVHCMNLYPLPLVSLSMFTIFLFVYIPLLCIALLFYESASAEDHSLDRTPRKRRFIVRPIDQQRFTVYLCSRALSLTLPMILAGYLAVGNIYQIKNESSFLKRYFFFVYYYINVFSTKHIIIIIISLETIHMLSNTISINDNYQILWLIQDAMSIPALIGIFIQAWTLQAR